MSADPPATEQVRDLAAELLAAVERVSAPPPLLLEVRETCRFVGLSKSSLYRLLSADGFPKPIDLPGVGPRWRRADLERWAEKLKPARRRPVPITS